jgi:nicotinamide-nucleotide amidase
MNSIHVLALGSELLSGFVLESNAHWLQQQLQDRDALVVKVTVLPDHMDDVVKSIQSSASQCDTLIICGGLGPTDDDLTREAVAIALGVKLRFNDEAWAEIEAFFAKPQRPVSPSNRRQADVPEGCSYLKNSCGTAPGLLGKIKNCDIYAFPGVPREFKLMCEESFLGSLPTHQRGPIYKLWGIGESNLVDLLNEHRVFPQDFEWNTIARTEGITIHFPSSFENHPEKINILTRFENCLASYIYAKEDITPVQLLSRALKTRKLKLCTAESCTGGLLSSWFTAQPGSSEYFEGGIVSYSNAIKENILGVDSKTLNKHGAVSEPCAIAMAEGAQKKLNCDLAISITGIAGPTGGTTEKPVGTIHYAVAHRDGRTLHECKVFHGHREGVRERSAHAATLLALKLLDS